MIRVLVAEDMRILRDMLVSMLNLEDDIKVVAQVGDGAGVVPAALAERPDLAVLDIDMPEVDGLTAAAELHNQLPACRVVILTVLGRPGQLRQALAAHVSGFLVKDTPSEQLVGVLRRVAAGERVIDPKLALATLEMKESPLSEREADVLRRFAAGAEPAEIAAELFLSYGTVRNYLASAVMKVGGRNRVDAVRIARDAGWLLRGDVQIARRSDAVCRLAGAFRATAVARRAETAAMSDEPAEAGAVIRLLVAEDTRILRETLVTLFSLEDGIEVIAQVAAGTGIVPAAIEHRPDVALLDIGMPGADGLSAAAELSRRLPDCSVVVLTALEKPDNRRRAAAAGVSGFLLKGVPAATLIGAVRSAARQAGSRRPG